MHTVRSAKKKLSRLEKKLGDHDLTVRSICQHLNKEFRSMSVRFTSEYSDSYSITGFFAGAVKMENELLYNIHINYDDVMRRVPAAWFIRELESIIVHELRHLLSGNFVVLVQGLQTFLRGCLERGLFMEPKKQTMQLKIS